MTRKIIIFLTILAAAALQVTAMTVFFPSLAVPDIMLVVVVLWTVRDSFEKNLPRTVIMGFFSDLASFRPPGESVIVFAVISYFVSLSARRFLVSQRAWKLFFLIVIIVFSTLAEQILYFSFLSAIALVNGQEWPQLTTFFGVQAMYKILFNIIILCLMYWPVKKIENFLAFYNTSSIAHKK